MRTVIDKPRLRPDLAVRVVGDDKVFLLSEDRQHLMRGRDVAILAPFLEGRHSVEEILAATGLGFADFVRALTRFHRGGHLVGDPPPSRSVTLVTFTSVGKDEVVSALQEGGVELGEGLPLLLVDDYLDARIGEFDERMRRAGQPWMLAKPTGGDVWVGPCFRPGATGCWECLRARLDGNRPIGRYLRLTTGETVRPPVVATPATLRLAGALITNAVLGESPDGVLISVRAEDLRTERHQLIAQPQCPACGDPALMPAPAKIQLTAQPAPFGRVCPPEATYARLEKHISRLLGAITAVREVEGAEAGVAPSYVAGHNFALQAGNLDGLRRTLRGQSGGKGRTDSHARTSAVCEAIERFCGVWRDDHATKKAPYAEVADKAIAPGKLLLFSDKQYAQGNAGRLHTVPERFDPWREISWSTAWSLTNQQERLVPTGYAYFGHPDLEEHTYCYPDANGNAAGNTIEEAVLHGFCELVERDSVALWWYNRLRLREFDLDRLGDPYVAQLRDFYAAQDRELWVLDLTADLGVPTFAAVSRRGGHEREDVLLGFGAHLDTDVAVMRALTEMNQFLPGVRGRLPDGSTDYREDDPDVLAWWRDIRVAEHPWLLPHGRSATVDTTGSGELKTDVLRCVEVARRAGIEVVVLDQSRPDIELAVVKVMAPGLRHFWRRLGPGRLYDVPVRLGRLDVPTTEDGCNPVSVFF